MQRGIVGKLAIGAQPYPLAVGGLAVAGEWVVVDVAQVDGPRSVVPLAHAVFVRGHAGLEVGQRFRGRNIGGHRHLVVEPRLGDLKAGLQVEDCPAMLNGHHTTGGETLAVADAVDLVQDRQAGVAGPEKVGVQRVHMAIGFHCACGSNEGLAGDLAAEHALAVLVGRDSTEEVHLDRFQIEQVH